MVPVHWVIGEGWHPDSPWPYIVEGVRDPHEASFIRALILPLGHLITSERLSPNTITLGVAFQQVIGKEELLNL